MKRLLLIVLPLLLIVGCSSSQKEYDINHIEKLNGVYIKEISNEIVNGEVFQMVGDMKLPLGKLKDGKNEGKWISWYPNGQKWSEETYKNGYSNGLSTSWYEDGQKKFEGTYKDGECDGLTTWWYGNGQKMYEGTYKDGESISEKHWDEDGSVWSND